MAINRKEVLTKMSFGERIAEEEENVSQGTL